MAPPVGHINVCVEFKTFRSIIMVFMLHACWGRSDAAWLKKIGMFLNIICIFQDKKFCAALCVTESQII